MGETTSSAKSETSVNFIAQKLTSNHYQRRSCSTRNFGFVAPLDSAASPLTSCTSGNKLDPARRFAVTDWAHYSNAYTSAILNLPQDDTLAYHQSSPIYCADGLRAPLLMAHGMVDTNVNYEDIVRLTERLIELGKTDWELASYPVDSHEFLRPDSWTDEDTRIFSPFQRTIARPSAQAAH